MTNNEITVLSAIYDLALEYGSPCFELLEEEVPYTIKQLRGIITNLQSKKKIEVFTNSCNVTVLMVEGIENPDNNFNGTSEDWDELKRKALAA